MVWYGYGGIEGGSGVRMIKRMILGINKYSSEMGIDFIKMMRSISSVPFFISDYVALKKQKGLTRGHFEFGSLWPCLSDRRSAGGVASGAYFHHDLLIARRIYENNPKNHVDIGSRIDGLVAHIASFREVTVFDIRPANSHLKNISFLQLDMMEEINDKYINYCDSISCLSVIEHFGLGRYGDKIDYDGYLLGLNNLYRMLLKNGKLYVSVPMGPRRIEFNAHRVFDLKYLLKLFDGKYVIDMFSFIDDEGNLHEDINMADGLENNFGCHYGHAVFEMTKL